VSADSAQTGQPRTAPQHSGFGLMLCVAAAAASAIGGLPLDPLLAGMVAAGQGLRAICLYLGLAESALDRHLARLGLPRPHDRPLRKPGPRGWSVADTIRLIFWRVRGVHPETIGQRLDRSPNAVRAKARRLGIPRPDRKSLHRAEPAKLADPLARCADGAGAVWGMPAEPLDVPGVRETQSGDDLGLSFLAGGPEPTASAEPGDLIRERRAKSSRSGERHQIGTAGEITLDRRPKSKEVGGQPELPLAREPSLPRTLNHKPAATSDWRRGRPIPREPDEVYLSGDLTWIGAARKRQQNRAAVWAVGMLRFGGLDWRVIAVRTGMTLGAARSFLTRAGVPVDRARKKFSAVFDEECARETERRSGFEVASNTFFTKNDREVTEYFWRRKSDRATVKRSRARRRAVGNLDPYQSETIEILTRADLDVARGTTHAFAEHPATLAQQRTSRGGWHEEPARRRDTPPHRSGFSGRAGQPMFVADVGHGGAAGGFADP
jgi:hypothetical protein